MTASVTANASIAHQSIPGVMHQTLANADAGLKHLSVWRQTMASGAATPPHRHDCEEVVLVEAGSGEVHIDGQVIPFGPDTTLVIPPGVDHQIFNTGTQPLRTLAAFSGTPVGTCLPDGNPIDLPWRS